MKPPPRLSGRSPRILTAKRSGWILLGIAFLLVLCSGCKGPSARKLKVTHSPLSCASVPCRGKVVLREGIGSYNVKREIIGQKRLEGGEFFVLFNPMASFAFVTEIEGRRNLNTVMRGYLSEVLTNAGYEVRIQKDPRKELPKKLKGTPILEFGIGEFDYTYGSSRGAPNTMEIDLRLSLLDSRATTTIWEQKYSIRKSSPDSGGETFIREAVDELLARVAADVASEEFRTSLR